MVPVKMGWALRKCQHWKQLRTSSNFTWSFSNKTHRYAVQKVFRFFLG